MDDAIALVPSPQDDASIRWSCGMGVLGWLRSIVGSNGRRHEPDGALADGPPTEAEMQSALDRLQQMVRPAVFGEIGGMRPDKEKRAASWWGGGFLAAEGETVPVCERSGRSLHPLLQIRVDEVPEVLPAFAGLALVTIWVDLADIPLDDAENGNGFVVRTYPTLVGLVPVGPGYRDGAELPSFPVRWRAAVLEQPSWNDIAFEIPTRVAQSSHSEWFFDSRYAAETSKHQATCPIKLGGWPSWIQGENWPDDAEFCLQVDSTAKGRFSVGDRGSIYVFRTPRGWAIRSDFY